MEYKTPQDLPYDFSSDMDDFWTVFADCPLEKGHIDVYLAFAQARARAFENYKNQDLGFEI